MTEQEHLKIKGCEV